MILEINEPEKYVPLDDVLDYTENELRKEVEEIVKESYKPEERSIIPLKEVKYRDIVARLIKEKYGEDTYDKHKAGIIGNGSVFHKIMKKHTEA